MIGLAPRPSVTAPDSGVATTDSLHHSPWARAAAWGAAHWRGALWLVPVLVFATWLQATNMYGAPAFTGDEGTYVSQAWAVLHWHTLAPYTYWFDSPPFGWIVLAGFDGLTHAFSSAPSAIDGGRQFMVVCNAVSVSLLYVLGRRLGLARWSAAGAALLFAASPLAVKFHRQVYLDNIGLPFLLASFVLAVSPRKRLAAQAGAGLCFGLAVLSKETYLLLLPALAWQIWRHADERIRGFVIATASTLFGLCIGVYVLYAALNDELLPGKGHVSLIGTAIWQLVGRASSGSILTAGTPGANTLSSWLALDPWLLGMGLVLLPLALVRRSTRAIGVAGIIEAATLIRPGYLPFPFVIGMLPFAALITGSAVDMVARWQPDAVTRRLRTAGGTTPSAADDAASSGSGRRLAGSAGSITMRLLGPLAATTMVAAGVALAAPSWIRNDRVLLTADQSAPYLSAQHWIAAHVSRHDRLLVGDSLWVNVVDEGFPANQVVWYSKLGTDPQVDARFPQRWHDFQYIVVSSSVRGSEGTANYRWLSTAIAHSTTTASWGHGSAAVTIRRIDRSSQVLPSHRSSAH